MEEGGRKNILIAYNKLADMINSSFTNLFPKDEVVIYCNKHITEYFIYRLKGLHMTRNSLFSQVKGIGQMISNQVEELNKITDFWESTSKLNLDNQQISESIDFLDLFTREAQAAKMRAESSLCTASLFNV
jgi:hypothetical protein